jgi:DNA-binding NarL/FixJ family response regulator
MNAQKRQLDREGMCISLNTLLSDSEDSSEEWIQNIQSVSIEDNPLYLLQLDELYKEQDDRTKFIIHSKLQGHQTKHIAKQLNVSGQTIRRIWNSLEREVRDIVAD